MVNGASASTVAIHSNRNIALACSNNEHVPAVVITVQNEFDTVLDQRPLALAREGATMGRSICH